MCGIAGFCGSGDQQSLLEMMAALKHRGPDDEGVFIDRPVHLGHQRLSIIDLSARGRQPMCNEDASVWIVCNGEIYNFQTLRTSLRQKGHRFHSDTDSEVILHLYEEYGTGVFEKLNGMFAIALWDRRKRKLYLARDRMGQKPLYYAFVKGTFLFASEARALIAHPLMEKKISLKSLAKYLFYEHVPTPDCIWEDAAQLMPASYLVYEPETARRQVYKYWKLRYLPRLSIGEKDLQDALEEKLIRSIRRHLVADVPVGVYLSGGMDSTSLAYYSQKILNGRLKTFTIAFQEKSFDEQHRAREMAERIGSDHHEIEFHARDFLNTTLECVPKLDAPFADSSLIPAYFINRFAREHIKVALGGEGGDELFVGYPYFRAHELLKYLRSIPSWIRRKAVYPLIRFCRTSHQNETRMYQLKKFIEAEGYLDNPYYCQQIWLGAFGPDRLPGLFRKEYHHAIRLDELFENIDLYRKEAEQDEELMDGLMRQTQQKYLMDDGLTKTDRASMANSLEMRAPLLDNELVEWVNRVPFHRKYQHGNTKMILKKLMRDKIPDRILNGRKRGFTPPIAEWFTRNFRAQIKEYLFLDDGLFNTAFIERIWNEHLSHKQNHRKLLWTLFVWKLWSSVNCS